MSALGQSFNDACSRHLLAQLKSGKSINVEKIGYIRAITDTYTQEEKKISRKDWLSEELDI